MDAKTEKKFVQAMTELLSAHERKLRRERIRKGLELSKRRNRSINRYSGIVRLCFGLYAIIWLYLTISILNR